MEALAAELGCRIGHLPSFYLGLPLGPNTTPQLFRLALMKECTRDFLFGKETTSPKEGK